ncbi:hypothetical protein CANCADRAFT_46176 [Tortispora caseinolytica NRRL Y-17796]|uniref:Amino acid permease/ SLC12A domain-containing protein n=1 Tax=Tortispora caseinolytica NRRL Y-17796 TaxID=767744 RepID=A0A1E4TDJ2_9ASCO|nr:hypothetical protein CANCADRAFT_46176 [Tortispora caseinolytica NRRL Y-17796]
MDPDAIHVIGHHDNLSDIDIDVEKINVTSVLSGHHAVLHTDHAITDDEARLAALGYKQEFRREFSVWSSFAVSFAVLGLLPSIASTMYFGLGYAGTAGISWGWIVSMIGVQAVASSMAEICSSMPTSGGLYYAVAVLAPPKWAPFASWITGWSNWIAQVTGAPSVDYSLASMIMSLAQMRNPDFTPETYQVYLLTLLIIFVHACISSLPTKWIARFNSMGTSLNIIFLFVCGIILLAANDRESVSDAPTKWNTNSYVWSDIHNQTEWPDGVAVLMSFIAILWTMSGYDAPFHLAEECTNAAVASPRAIVLTAGVGGTMGWLMNLIIAYTVVNIDEVILSDDLGQPWATYCRQVVGNDRAQVVVGLTIVAGFFMGQGCMVAASRVTYAYARDGCFPMSRFWRKVNTHSQTPVNAVFMNATIGALLCLLMFGGSTAIDAIFSVGAIAAYIAFATPTFVKVFFVGKKFRRGPWHLGPFSQPIGLLSCAWVTIMIPFLNFPQYKGADNTPDMMNWTCVVYGGSMGLAIVWFIIDARKWFRGPKVNIEDSMHSIVIEGEGPSEDGMESSLNDKDSAKVKSG